MWCFLNTFQAEFFEWSHMKDVVSQPVRHQKAEEQIQNQPGDFRRYFCFLAVADIMYRLGQGMQGSCATRSNKTSVSLADTTMLVRLLLTQ